jgi:outer membrane protein OmpA-like peptidoglycan-associated protein
MTSLKTLAALGLMGATLWAAPGLALAQDPAPLKGLVISNDGATMVVRNDAGDTPVKLTGETKVRGVTGVLGVRGSDYPASTLIRGLPVEVVTAPNGEAVTASEVTFKTSDLKTAQQISAGLVSTDAAVAANSERIDNVGLLVPAGRTKVFFPVGSATISEKGKKDLQAIAEQAKGIKGAYRIAVVGRADPSGNAAANQRLSEARAAAVTEYLQQSAAISPANFIPTAALGSAPVAQDPDEPKNAAEARRVTVTIAVSKSSQTAAAK